MPIGAARHALAAPAPRLVPSDSDLSGCPDCRNHSGGRRGPIQSAVARLSAESHGHGQSGRRCSLPTHAGAGRAPSGTPTRTTRASGDPATMLDVVPSARARTWADAM
jgi:hypothetical protein